MKAVETEDLGLLGYAEAFEVQRDRHARVLGARESGEGPAAYILLVEHPHVITMTPRAGVAEHLLADKERLAREGVEVLHTDRGGDITYHGPGQVVVYPIVDLNAFGLNLHAYMRALEEAAIRTCSAFGVTGRREPGATGVWVGEGRSPEKVCAMGVRVRRWATMHGLALNVTTDLTKFDLIVPCGLHGRRVTSLRRLLAERCPPIAEVKRVLAREVERQIREGR